MKTKPASWIDEGNAACELCNYNTDLLLWISFFCAYPDEKETYLGNVGGCAVWIRGQWRARFSDYTQAHETFDEARKQAKEPGAKERCGFSLLED